jgi:hypothetical protein
MAALAALRDERAVVLRFPVGRTLNDEAPETIPRSNDDRLVAQPGPGPYIPTNVGRPNVPRSAILSLAGLPAMAI